jgi:hypothetical protein
MTEYAAQVMDTDDFLEHYGVKGMKWGHRKATSGEIHGARRRVEAGRKKVNAAEDKMATARTSKDAAAAKKNFDKVNKEFLNNPDRVTALRLTKGEKWSNAALIVLFPGAGAAAVGGFAVARGTSRNRIARRQASGHYNKHNTTAALEKKRGH